MGGGLMQLVAYGAQDIYLTGNPQITFFKVVYRRHTNFSIESIHQSFSGAVSNDASNVTASVARNGDLVTSMHLDVLLTGAATHGGAYAGNYTNWTNNTGHALIDYVELKIGGQKIDKHYGYWLDVWNEFTDHNGHEKPLINKQSAKNSYLKSNDSLNLPNLRMYVPLKFWFNRNPGLALPLVALQYHDIEIKLQTRGVNSLINMDDAFNPDTNVGTAVSFQGGVAPDIKLYIDYVYLDTDERRRFAQQSHEYLIEQLQYQNEVMRTSVKLNLNHPVKEIMWAIQDTTCNSTVLASTNARINAQGANMTQSNDWFNYMCNAATNTERVNSQPSNEPFDTMKISINGQDRFSAQRASYFRTVTPYTAGHKVPEKHVYCYSFALKPEEHQPSGTCNFSRIDNAKLVFTSPVTSGNAIHIFAVNYNVLRIMSGMGGLAYSN